MKKPRTSVIAQVKGSGDAAARGVQPSFVMSKISLFSVHAGEPSGKLAPSMSPRMRRFEPGARSLFARSGSGPVELACPAAGHASVQPFLVMLPVLALGVGVAPPHAASTAERATRAT
jgi:hypothetical protein